MRLNDLLESRVVAADGSELGRVRDVRLIQDGPPRGPAGQATLRVDSVVVGRGFSSRLLGYGENPVERPWLLHALVRWLEHEQQVVEWEDVADYRDGVVRIRR